MGSFRKIVVAAASRRPTEGSHEIGRRGRRSVGITRPALHNPSANISAVPRPRRGAR